MIKLITKNKYYELLGISNYKDYQIYKNIVFSKEKWNKLDCNCSSCIYFCYESNLSLKKYVFVYLKNFRVLLIPKIYKNIDEIYRGIINSDTTLNNWKVELLEISNKKEYLLNTFKFGSFYSSLEERGLDGVTYISGKYLITNLDFPEETIEFSLINNLRDPDEYWKRTFISYPKKPELMITDKKEVIYIEDLIAIILNENGGDYKESNIKS